MGCIYLERERGYPAKLQSMVNINMSKNKAHSRQNKCDLGQSQEKNEQNERQLPFHSSHQSVKIKQNIATYLAHQPPRLPSSGERCTGCHGPPKVDSRKSESDGCQNIGSHMKVIPLALELHTGVECGRSGDLKRAAPSQVCGLGIHTKRAKVLRSVQPCRAGQSGQETSRLTANPTKLYIVINQCQKSGNNRQQQETKCNTRPTQEVKSRSSMVQLATG